VGIMGNCSRCGVPLKIGYRSKPIGEVSDFDLCYDCAKKAGTLPNQETVDMCNIIAGSPPAESNTADGQALHTTTPAQNLQSQTSGVA
jgi:hypothetical protein